MPFRHRLVLFYYNKYYNIFLSNCNHLRGFSSIFLPMAFNENLKYFMECKEIQSKELAAKTDISINTINSYLKKSGSIPDIEKAVKIAKVLNIPAELLVTGISISEKKIEHMDRTNLLKPEIVEIEKKLIRFSQKDLEIIAQLIQSVWEKYEK